MTLFVSIEGVCLIPPQPHTRLHRWAAVCDLNCCAFLSLRSAVNVQHVIKVPQVVMNAMGYRIQITVLERWAIAMQYLSP